MRNFEPAAENTVEPIRIGGVEGCALDRCFVGLGNHHPAHWYLFLMCILDLPSNSGGSDRPTLALSSPVDNASSFFYFEQHHPQHHPQHHTHTSTYKSIFFDTINWTFAMFYLQLRGNHHPFVVFFTYAQ
jgi:hypothetical protein